MSEFDKDRSEVDQIIEEAVRSHLTLRPLTPALLRQVAEVWVAGRNRISDSSRRLMEDHGIHVSNKMEYVNPDHLKEPLYSAVLDLMVERGEWETEPGTNIPMYKRTPTINYTFQVVEGHADLIHPPGANTHVANLSKCTEVKAPAVRLLEAFCWAAELERRADGRAYLVLTPTVDEGVEIEAPDPIAIDGGADLFKHLGSTWLEYAGESLDEKTWVEVARTVTTFDRQLGSLLKAHLRLESLQTPVQPTEAELSTSSSKVSSPPPPWLEGRLQALDDQLRASGLTVTVTEPSDTETFVASIPQGKRPTNNRR